MKPKITYKKWWQRFIPSWRKKIKLMNIMLDWQWENGMKEEVEENVRHMIIYGYYKIK